MMPSLDAATQVYVFVFRMLLNSSTFLPAIIIMMMKVMMAMMKVRSSYLWELHRQESSPSLPERKCFSVNAQITHLLKYLLSIVVFAQMIYLFKYLIKLQICSSICFDNTFVQVFAQIT